MHLKHYLKQCTRGNANDFFLERKVLFFKSLLFCLGSWGKKYTTNVRGDEKVCHKTLAYNPTCPSWLIPIRILLTNMNTLYVQCCWCDNESSTLDITSSAWFVLSDWLSLIVCFYKHLQFLFHWISFCWLSTSRNP